MSDPASVPNPRRHDLDALRAFAMLLGIGLHASLSFMPGGWPAQDSRPNGLYGLFFASIHGFRMQLFFVLSGFFTAMVWRKRGLRSLVKQRFQRVFLPCLLGCLTIVPLTNWVMGWAITARSASTAAEDPSSLISAIKKRDHAALTKLLDEKVNADETDAAYGIPALNWAALLGDAESVRLLLDHGANINVTDREGSGPLHVAAWLGRKEVLELLIARGGDVTLRNKIGDLPADAFRADWAATKGICDFLKIPIGTQEELQSGREACVKRLGNGTERPAPSGLDGIRRAYAGFLTAPFWSLGGEKGFHLIFTPIFNHLWFLWFLCLFVTVFALVAGVVDRLPAMRIPSRFVVTPGCWLWLAPLTMIPQLLMGALGPNFGPDTSVGLIPQPHLVLYYGIFYVFGVFYFDADDGEGRLGRKWSLWLSFGIVALFLGLSTMGSPLVTGVFQMFYAWAMTFGMIGLFRSALKVENRTIRYLSDSAYWLYVAHLPLIVLVQAWVGPWALPSVLKFLFICNLVTVVLLIVYQAVVRGWWLGQLLNGPSARKPSAS